MLICSALLATATLAFVGLPWIFCPAWAADDRGWLGIYTDPVRELPRIEAQAGGEAALQGATCGLQVTAVFPDSPAEEGGIGGVGYCLGLFLGYVA